MQKYTIQKCLGEGTFAKVVQAKVTGEKLPVAIKVLKQPSLNVNSVEEAAKLREVQALKIFEPHPYIISLKELLL